MLQLVISIRILNDQAWIGLREGWPSPVVETLGGWEELAEKQIKRLLGAALARHTGHEEAEKTRHLFRD